MDNAFVGKSVGDVVTFREAEYTIKDIMITDASHRDGRLYTTVLTEEGKVFGFREMVNPDKAQEYDRERGLPVIS